MKSLTQSINESMIMELSSELLSRAAKSAKEKGRNSQAARFAVAAGKALEKELKGWKPGPDAKNCGKVVAAIKDLTETNPAMKSLVKADPATTTIHMPKLQKYRGNDPRYQFTYVGEREVKIPKGEFYVFRDEYHNNYHIGTLADIYCTIASAYWDFEDFDASYIIKAFDNLKDAVKYAREVGEKRFYDSESFMSGVEDGSISEDDCMWASPGISIIDMMLDWADIKDAPSTDYDELH